MTKTFKELKDGAEQIRTNRIPESNTATLVGKHLGEIVDKLEEENSNRLKMITGYNISHLTGEKYSDVVAAATALQEYMSILGSGELFKGTKLSYVNSVDDGIYHYEYNGGTINNLSSWKEVGANKLENDISKVDQKIEGSNYLFEQHVTSSISQFIDFEVAKGQTLIITPDASCASVVSYINILANGASIAKIYSSTEPIEIVATEAISRIQIYSSSSVFINEGDVKIEFLIKEGLKREIAILSDDIDLLNSKIKYVDELKSDVIGNIIDIPVNVSGTNISVIQGVDIAKGTVIEFSFDDTAANIFSYLTVFAEIGGVYANLTSINDFAKKHKLTTDNDITSIKFYASSVKSQGTTDITLSILTGFIGYVDRNTINDVQVVNNMLINPSKNVVNSNMTKAEFVSAMNYEIHTNYYKLCHVSSDCFPSLIPSDDIAVIYENINKIFRDDIYVDGMSYDLLCKRINKQFSQKIYRFCDAKPDPTDIGIDWSLDTFSHDTDSQEPSVLVVDGKLLLYASLKRFVSEDGVNFDEGTPLVLKRKGVNFGHLMHCGVHLIKGIYYLIGEKTTTSEIVMLTSTDGINFDYKGIIFNNNLDVFGDGSLIAEFYGNPELIYVDGKYTLFYEIHAASDLGYSMCSAQCTDILHANADGTIGNWVQNPNNQIMPAEVGDYRYNSGNLEIAKDSTNMPIKIEGRYYAYFHGMYGKYNTPSAAIYRAYSYDLLEWVDRKSVV